LSSETLFISAGGTGGGIYPALSVAEALRERAPHVNLHFIGSTTGIENELVPRQGWAGFHSVPSGALHGVGRVKQLSSLVKIVRGTWRAWRLAVEASSARAFSDRRLGDVSCGARLLAARRANRRLCA
jgi:UDP-N-acetylglucosamine:LPS N-acetylglucosamine transferase